MTVRAGLTFLLIGVMMISGCHGAVASPSEGIRVEARVDYQADAECAAAVAAIRSAAAPQSLPERYRDVRVIDIHNHGAAGNPQATLRLQAHYFVDRTVLFGDISEPSAVDTDRKAWETYERSPDRVYPFFAGIPLRDTEGITMAAANLEAGYFGIGEIVGASRYSPVTSRLPWKAEHPNNGILPQLYQLSARYRAPVLLHIDPPTSAPIRELEQALTENPDALIIFGHANAYNTPAAIEALVGAHPNLFIDFFAGFTAYNADSTHTLADYAPLIEKYPDRFMVSTDSGYGAGEEQALQAIYELLDLLTPETLCQVAHQNIERLIESQPPTATQIAQIETLSRQAGMEGVRQLNKRTANELLMELQTR